jgi:predicted AlkP superfamily pyrophosphatase or phosphodiesterase
MKKSFSISAVRLAQMVILACLVFTVSAQIPGGGQKPGNADAKLARPKLVVGLMVDQMRWDFLYRFYDRYSEGGLKRMLREGATCENTLIPYAQTVTASGHSCAYTGSVPAINGIMGNDWYDRRLGRFVYCVEDSSVSVLGGTSKSEPMSPRNLWVTSIADELRLATNFKSKVIGVAIKDRGSILPAGHTGTAYWYEGANGNWVSSTFYMNNLPAWVNAFNSRKVVDSLTRLNWNTLHPIETYIQSDKDNMPYEGRYVRDASPVFPYKFDTLAGRNYGIIRATPQGNTLTMQFAREAVVQEGLGQDDITDMLAISLSSPDYIGHQFGPNSIEIEDTYLRLDREFADFFAFLDAKVGKGAYTVFLTADHAVAHVPQYLKEHGIPVRTLANKVNELNQKAESALGIAGVIEESANYQLYLNYAEIAKKRGKTVQDVEDFLLKELNSDTTVLVAFKLSKTNETNLPAPVKEMFVQGYNIKLSGDIQVILKAGFFQGGTTGTTHGSWYPYDSHVPLVFMGWGIRPGIVIRQTYMTDIAPTLGSILHVQMPSGNIGQAIPEVIAGGR